MKSKISTFLLGILVTICIGAGVSNSELLTVKPATPKSIISEVCYHNEANSLIKKYALKGYMFKSYSGAGTSNSGVLVMEKY